MTLVFEKLETVEMLENRVNGAQGGTAKGIRLVAPTTCNQENDQSLRQKAQHGERPALLDASAAVFAHEVGNPLQSIFGTLECGETEFKKRRIVDPLLMSMIEAAIREVDRLRKLLQEFRCLASVQELHLQLADLAKIIEEVLALQRLGYRAAGIDVKLECENPLPSVMLDAAKINQVILNLCKNAVEAMPNGGVYRSECIRRGR